MLAAFVLSLIVDGYDSGKVSIVFNLFFIKKFQTKIKIIIINKQQSKKQHKTYQQQQTTISSSTFQEAMVKGNGISTCLLQLHDDHPGLKLWAILCLSKVGGWIDR